MSDTSSISSGVAARYATALFELAKDANTLPSVEKDLDVIDDALVQNHSLRDLFQSPVYSRDDVVGAISALAKKNGIIINGK